MSRELHLTAFLQPPADYDTVLSFVRTAEHAKFDAVFLADLAGVFEPTTLVATLAAATSHIGLITTGSTTDDEPYHLARAFASIDHISKGRAGWHVTTSRDAHARAEEFFDVVTGLWDSFDDDAFTRDKQSGLYFDPTKMHTLGYKGNHLSVAGPLNIARPPQGRPVIVTAPSQDDLRFAARVADVVVSDQRDLAEAARFYAALKSQATELGRTPDSIKVFPTLPVSTGLADHIESWFHAPAADGFTITVPDSPDALTEFVDQEIPELRRRGLFRHEYTGTTLRDHLGLTHPLSRYATS
jgi:N-acetyl-S-(2-succino)cysteine monooxygenase